MKEESSSKMVKHNCNVCVFAFYMELLHALGSTQAYLATR